MRSLVLGMVFATLTAGCGGDDDEPAVEADAAVADASLTERMQATLADVEICPGGYTLLEAVASETSIAVRAQCSETAVDVLLRFAPLPTPGGEPAECYEATFRNETGQSTCRVGSEVNAVPTGTATLGSSNSFLGECDCTGEAGIATAVFQLTLQ